MSMKSAIWSRHIVVVSGLLLAACAGTPQLAEVKEVYVCAAGECGPASQRYTATEMLAGLYELHKRSEGRDYTICESDPAGRNCVSEGVGYFVMGGPIPGRGSQKQGRYANVQYDAANHAVIATASNQLLFIGTPLACADTKHILTVRSADEIVGADENYYCNWAGVGNMTASFNFVVDYVDLDKGRLGGYWQHGVAGTGAGKGAGYAILQFPMAMPKGENWLKAGAAP